MLRQLFYGCNRNKEEDHLHENRREDLKEDVIVELNFRQKTRGQTVWKEDVQGTKEWNTTPWRTRGKPVHREVEKRGEIRSGGKWAWYTDLCSSCFSVLQRILAPKWKTNKSKRVIKLEATWPGRAQPKAANSENPRVPEIKRYQS